MFFKDKPHVLLVEDQLFDQQLCRAYLYKLGFNVSISGTGEMAVRMFQMHPFDVVLMDINLPGISGVEASEHILKIQKKTGHQVPIIACTTYVPGEIEKYIDAGMVDHLIKPYNLEQLGAVLNKWVYDYKETVVEDETEAEAEG